MENKTDVSLEASEEQLLYAKFLEVGMYVGLAILFITYFLYIFGIMEPYIPLSEVSHYWSLNVGDYLHEANIHAGWSWVRMVGYGDFINFIGIAMLAGVTIFCYIAIIPLLIRTGDTVYAVIAALEALVLILAASGLITGGH